MYLEQLISEYNKPKTFKVIAFFILALPSYQFNNQIQNIMFSLVTPNITCQYESAVKNVSISSDQCSVNVQGSIEKCTDWKFSTEPIGKTMISDYKLVCDNKFYGELIPILWYVSFLVGPIWGMLSDQFGRKKIVLCCLFLETVSTICVALSINVYSQIIFQILLGFSGSGVFIAQVWLMEMVDIGFRPVVGSFFWIYWAIAYMAFPIISYFSRDWRISQLVSLLPSSLYLAILLIPESPRWSCVMNRKDELMESLKKIFKINRLSMNLNGEEIFVEKSTVKGNIFSDFKDLDFASRTVFGLLCFLSSNLIYTASLFNINQLSNNIYISVFFLGLMEIPSMILSYFSLKYCPRKKEFYILGGLGSILFLISVFFNPSENWQAVTRIVIGCLAKIAIATCNQNLLVYVIELLPTTHRSFGYSLNLIVNVISYCGATYINKLSMVVHFLPMLIYSIFIWITMVIMFLWLPETKDLPFPETLSDLKMLKRGKEDLYIYYMNNKKDYSDGTENNIDKTIFSKDDEKTILVSPKID